MVTVKRKKNTNKKKIFRLVVNGNYNNYTPWMAFGNKKLGTKSSKR